MTKNEAVEVSGVRKAIEISGGVCGRGSLKQVNDKDCTIWKTTTLELAASRGTKLSGQKVVGLSGEPFVSLRQSLALLPSGTAYGQPNTRERVVAGEATMASTFVESVKTCRKPHTCKPLLLWIGDALVPTGFATVTHAVVKHLVQDWEVVVSGVNYDGSPHDLSYQVLPAWQGGDMWGVDRFKKLCAELRPAAVVINNDWWNVANFMREAPANVPIIGYMPVDGGNLDPTDISVLNRLHAAVWYTTYGFEEAWAAGFRGARHVIPHGIDTSLFQPMARGQARQLLGLNVPADAFIVGNLNRNQPRKRLDLTVQIFARWVKSRQISNTFLLLHCAHQDAGWDLHRLAAYHGIEDRLLLTGEEDLRQMRNGSHLQLVYNSLDVQMSTTLGEGWGLTTMEGMACGVPQIVPDSSALAEWASPAIKIPCSRTLMHPEINTVGALVDEEPFIDALHALYADASLREQMAEAGLILAKQARFRWAAVAGQFQRLLAPLAANSLAKEVCS